METAWGSLYQTSLFRGNTLEQTKEKFSKLNVVEISNFLKELDDFVEKFDLEGPAVVGEDMDRGLVLMEVRKNLLRFVSLSGCLKPLKKKNLRRLVVILTSGVRLQRKLVNYFVSFSK